MVTMATRFWMALFVLPGMIVFLLFFILPTGGMLAEAASDGGAAFLRLARDPVFWNSLGGSLFVGLAAPSLSLVVGTAVAMTIARLSTRASAIVLFAISLPLTFSGLIIAYGFILLLGRAGFVTQLLAMLGADPAIVGGFIFSPAGLGLAYSYYLIPRVVLVVLPAVRNFDQNQILASRSLGASHHRALIDIMLPQLTPSLIAAFCLTAAVSIGAYGTALALTGTQLNILPLMLYSRISDTGTDLPSAAALSLLLMVLCSLVITLAETSRSLLKGLRLLISAGN
jgi:putative spermidine/putrescine transport system permease protein